MQGKWGLFLALGILATSAALALVDPAQDSRLGTLYKYDPATSAGVIGEAPEKLGDPTLSSGWTEFKNSSGGTWKVFLDRRSGSPLLVEGAGLPWFDKTSGPITLAALETKAREFLGRHELLFRFRGEELILDRQASVQFDPDRWQVVFRRQVDNTPVEGEMITLLVSQGRMVAFGSSRWSSTPTLPSKPTLSADQAWQALLSYLSLTDGTAHLSHPAATTFLPGLSATSGSNEKYEGAVGQGSSLHRAWVFDFEIPGERGLYVGKVDTETGAILAFFDRVKYGQVKGGVYPVSNDQSGFDGTEQKNWPMPFADVTIDGTQQTANSMGIFADGPSNSTASTVLAGPYVQVEDSCGAINQSGPADGEIDLLFGPGTDCDIPAGASAGNTHASRSGFYHLNRVMEKGRAWLPDNAWLKSQLRDRVNISVWCNATYGGNQVNFYKGDGSSCRNTGEIAGVFVHEWGHGIDENDGGGWDNPSEAYADTVAFLQTHVSCVGRGFYLSQNCDGYGDKCLNCSGIRDQDWDKHQEHAPATADGFLKDHCGGGGGPCGKEEHCEAYVAAETIWDLATRDLPAAGYDLATSWQITDKLFYKSRKGSGGGAYNCSGTSSDGCSSSSWFTKFRNIDDDDGNLSNGTPHAAAIFAAFSRHKIACGAAGDASNQNSSSCPALSAPVLNTAAGSGSATLTWAEVPGASRYLILRNDQSCDAGHTIIATVEAPATSYVDVGLPNDFPVYYALQAQGSNTACDSAVSGCKSVTPQPFAGTIKLDRANYGCSVPINISVYDANIGAPTTTVSVFSTSEAEPETVVLTQAATGSARYVGTIFTTPNPAVHGDGFLTVKSGDLITAQYLDADDGMGGTNLVRQATAGTDCVSPQISQVSSSNITDTQATIHWFTDKGANTQVRWGGTAPPGQVSTKAETVTDHSLTLTGLSSCTIYYFAAESLDPAGNTAVDNNAGQYYHFETLGLFDGELQGCHAGKVRFDRPAASCADTLQIQVTDLDLNTDSNVAETVTITLSSTSEWQPETVTLTETGPNTAQFKAAVPTTLAAAVHGDGKLSVQNGDLISATYLDSNDGTGQGAISSATVTADCQAPRTDSVVVDNITDKSARVTFTTSEPTTAQIEWGTSASLGNTIPDTNLGTTHVFTLQPLTSCGRIYFRLQSTDAYGNSKTEDLSGKLFQFNANKIPGVVFQDGFETDKGWTKDGEWQIAAPKGLGTAPPDPSSAYAGTKVLGHDLTGLGTKPGDYPLGVTEYVTSPTINASALTNGKLYFKRWLNCGRLSQAGVDVYSKSEARWVAVWTSNNWFGESAYSWEDQEIDISKYADKNATLKIRFRQRGATGDSRSGWNIDELMIRDSSLPDFDVCGACGGTPTFGGLAEAVDANPCGAGGVNLKWHEASAWGTGHKGSYAVYRDTVPNFTPSAANLIAKGLTGTTYNDPNPPADTLLYYLVRAENDETCSGGPNNHGATDDNRVYLSTRDTAAQAAPAPVGDSLSLVLVNRAHVRLAWNAATQAFTYHILRSPNPVSAWVSILDTPALIAEDRDQALNANSWYYLVRSANACGTETP